MKGNLYNHQLLASIRDAKYTQERFAEMIGVTTITLSRMENGHGASYELILKACQALDIDSSKIFYSSRHLALAT
jgi:transcriptional regulator with XRE-family HTH domain